MSNFNQVRLRTTRDIRVVPYNHISKTMAEKYGLSKNSPSTIDHGFGYALSIKERNTIQEIDQDTALLLLSMKAENFLPNFLFTPNDTKFDSCLNDLILAELLEVKIGNTFVSGISAINKLSPNPRAICTKSTESNVMTEISHTAIKAAVNLNLSHQQSLTNFLYAYNTIPASQNKRTTLDDDRTYLRLNKIDPFWILNDTIEGWYYFKHPTKYAAKSKYKLYINPKPSHLTDTLCIVSETLKVFDVISFKVGKGSRGILRPDKLVAYFDSIEILMEAAKVLQKKLKDVPAHPVPFTALYDEKGLITWGMDPKTEKDERKSWRQWIIEKLTNSIVNTSEKNAKYDTALTSLSIEGINPSTFRPGAKWTKQYS